MSILSKVSSAFFCLPGTFYSFFPTLRTPYVKIHTVNEALSKIEKVAFAHFPSPKEDEPRSLSEQRRTVTRDIQSTVFDGKTLLEWSQIAERIIEQTNHESLYKHEKQELDLLKQQCLALKYRSGIELKGCSRHRGYVLYYQVEALIRQYIGHGSIFPGRTTDKDGHLPELTAIEKDQLLIACTRYPLLIQEFLKRHEENPGANDPWTMDFIKWALRSGCNVGVFVKAPMERRLLSEAHLDKRSGAIDGKKGVHFSKMPLYGSMVKVLSLHIDGKMCPMQGDYKKQHVHLKNIVSPSHEGMTLTIEKIIELFKKKTHSYGPVEYLQGGIRNWNAILLGSYNDDTKAYDRLDPRQMLRQLHHIAPQITLSATQVQQRYHLPSEATSLQDGQWALVMRASRQKANLNVLDAHGYLEVVHRNGGTYSVFSMGVQPIDLPSNPLSKLFYFSATEKAGLHYPDESSYLSQRQHASLFMPLTPEDEVRLQTTVQTLYEKGQSEDLVFQFGGMNCGYHVQQVFDQVVAAPFYDKIKEAVGHVCRSRNVLSEAWTELQMQRALEGLNHEALESLLSGLVNDLWEQRDSEGHLQELLDHSIMLMRRLYHKDFARIDLKTIDYSNPVSKKDIKKLLFLSVENIRFYRLDLFESQADQPVLAAINKIIKTLPWRWAKRLFINLVMLILGSWRWEVINQEGKGDSPSRNGSVKSVLTNPLLHEGYLHHPAALWRWQQQYPQRKEQLEEILARLNKK